MVGGIIISVIRHKQSQCILVRDGKDEMWRRVTKWAPVEQGDSIWWQSGIGYLTSADRLYRDDCIGSCRPTNKPERHWTGKEWIDL